jgi:tetratricopeptide (TPR) repeat protein
LPDLWLAELARLIPELGVAYPALPLSVPLDPELSRGRLAEAMHQWLRVLGRQRPVCLFLDDLQWIDHASLALLEYLLRHSSGLPLMILGAQRKREAGRHWQETQRILTREGLCHRLVLYRLSFPEVATIARHVGFRTTNPDAFLKRLFRETEGNPLFVIEILRSLQKMDVDPSGEWPIPTTIKGVIQSGLGRLSKQTRKMLIVAAVIGRAFDYRILHAVTDQPSEAVLSALEEGIAAGLIVEQADHYDFTHDKIRAVLSDSTSRARRQYLHRRIARTVEKLHTGDLSSFFGFLANHFEAAGEAELACHYALRAAKRAVELYADEDAMTWYDRALALSEIASTELAPEIIPQVIPFQQLYIPTSLPLDIPGLVYRQQGLIHQRTGRYDVARQHFRLALTRATNRGRLDEQAAAHSLLSYLAYLHGDYDAVAEHAQQSLELATCAGEGALRAEGLRNLGIAAYRTGDYQRAIGFYRESLSASRSINDQASMAKCYNNVGFALRTMERFDEAVASFQQALELHEATGSIEGAAGVLANIGSVYLRSGDLEQALAYLKRAIALSNEVHADWITAKAYRTLGNVYLRDGQWTQALASTQKARDLAEKLGSKEDLGAACRLLGEIAAAWPESGLGAADGYFEESLVLLREVGEQYELTRAMSSLEAYREARSGSANTLDSFDELLTAC